MGKDGEQGHLRLAAIHPTDNPIAYPVHAAPPQYLSFIRTCPGLSRRESRTAYAYRVNPWKIVEG